MTTLEEAIAFGRGVERPFHCHVHGGTGAHASVNVVKNVWFCFSCKAKGVVDSTRVPTADELLAMLEPEQAAREFPESWLEVYRNEANGYWSERFPDWLCWLLGFGDDPFTGEGTYPVHTPRGRLAGVARRAVVPGPGPKYRYPLNWSAARSLFGTSGKWTAHDLLVLTEGAADAAAVIETGVQALACYGAGLHAPQVELVVSMRPRLVLLGFDMDDAGAKATEQAWDALSEHTVLEQIDWGEAKDPAELAPEERLGCVLRAVGGTQYGQGTRTSELEAQAAEMVRRVRKLYVEESAA